MNNIEMPPKSKKVEEKSSPKSPKNKTKRCPKGEHRNPITGICEKKKEREIIEPTDIIEPIEKESKKIKEPKKLKEPKEKKIKEPKQIKEPKEKQIKEPKEKNQKKKTEIREKPINLKKMNKTEIKIFDQRRACIQKYRKKIPSLLEGSQESEE
jgi:hypothetical protein